MDDEAAREKGFRDLTEILDLTTGASRIIEHKRGERLHIEAMTADGQHLFTDGPGEVLRVVNTADLEEVCRFPLPSGFEMMTEVMPDGRFVLQTKAGEQLRLKLHLPDAP